MEAASIPAGTPARRRSRGLSERRLAALMVSPSLTLIALVAAYPIIYAIWLSLHEYSVRVAGLSRWAGPTGLRNYSAILWGDRSAEWWNAVKTTFIFTGFSVGFELLLGLGMALAMHSAFRGRACCGRSCSCPGPCSPSSPRSCGGRSSIRRSAS